MYIYFLLSCEAQLNIKQYNSINPDDAAAAAATTAALHKY